MSRADRLFAIVKLLRGRGSLTALEIAEELGVSERTVYRDIGRLIETGVPIVGEAGVGYQMGRSFEMPPLLLDLEEVEALVLGMRMVRNRGDRDLARAAQRVSERVNAILPSPEQEQFAATSRMADSFEIGDDERRVVKTLRRAIKERRRVSFEMSDERGRQTVRPLGLFVQKETWVLAAWSEQTESFCSFRSNAMLGVRLLKEPFELRSPVTLDDFVRVASSLVD